MYCQNSLSDDFIVEVQKLNRMAEENLEQGMPIASELSHEIESLIWH